VEIVLDAELDALYEATVDVVEEAVLNAICAGVPMKGHSDHQVPALPIAEARRIVQKQRA
jgi:D-aminopeptidase